MFNRSSTRELQALDAKHHLHPFTNHKTLRRDGARVIVRAEGPYIWDSDGRRVLDGMSGLWTTGIGAGRKELADAAYQQLLELPYYNTFFQTTHPRAVELSAKLADIAPANINQVFFGTSGSESNDTAVRLIRYYWAAIKNEPKRRIIMSRQHAYHGSTIAATSLGGMELMHGQMYPLYEGFRHVMAPYWYGNAEDGETPDEFGLRAAKAIEDEILAVGPENVAAFAGEPVQGAGGLKIAPSTYWPEVQRIVDKYGILLLADEVITGFGRLGTWFASEHYKIRPDLVTFAKAATSGYIPLSGLMVGDRVAEALAEHDDEFYHGYTFAGHPVACAVALKNIEIMQREGLVERVNAFTGPRLAQMLAKFKDHPLVGETRSAGLLGALELVANKERRERFADLGRVGTICRDHFAREGFIMRAIGDTMVTAPPLIFTEAHFQEAEAIIGKVLDLTLNDVRGELTT